MGPLLGLWGHFWGYGAAFGVMGPLVGLWGHLWGCGATCGAAPDDDVDVVVGDGDHDVGDVVGGVQVRLHGGPMAARAAAPLSASRPTRCPTAPCRPHIPPGCPINPFML